MAKEETRVSRKRLAVASDEAVLITPPGLAQVCAVEVQQIIDSAVTPLKSKPTLQIEKGSIIVKGASSRFLHELLMRSGTISDLFIRLSAAKVFHKNEVQAALTAIPFRSFIPAGSTVSFRVDAVASKLWHEGLLRELTQHALHAAGLKSDRKRTSHFFLDVMLKSNRLEAHLSLAGNPLWQRGWRTEFKAVAPLREEMARALVFATLQFIQEKAPANNKFETIFVPFAGSGTLGFEAMAAGLNLPAVAFRNDFAVQHFVDFPQESWQWLQRGLAKNAALSSSWPKEVLFADTDKRARASITSNGERFIASAKEFCGEKSTPTLKILDDDFFQFDFARLLKTSSGNLFLPLNPPRGQRLASRNYGTIGAQVAEWAKLMTTAKRGLAGFVLCPGEAEWGAFSKAIRHLRRKTIHFTQGGQDIRVCMFANHFEEEC